jgi:hypothetical protein
VESVEKIGDHRPTRDQNLISPVENLWKTPVFFHSILGIPRLFHDRNPLSTIVSTGFPQKSTGFPQGEGGKFFPFFRILLSTVGKL